MDDTSVTLHSQSGSYIYVFSLTASDNCCKLKKTFTILYLASGKTMCLSSNWSSQDSCLRSSTFPFEISNRECTLSLGPFWSRRDLMPSLVWGVKRHFRAHWWRHSFGIHFVEKCQVALFFGLNCFWAACSLEPLLEWALHNHLECWASSRNCLWKHCIACCCCCCSWWTQC